jgi:esterase/lipase
MIVMAGRYFLPIGILCFKDLIKSGFDRNLSFHSLFIGLKHDSGMATGECRIQLKEDLKAQLALWLAADQKVGVPELHRRRLLLRAGSLDNPEPTALSALVVHGLHDSPKAMTDLAEVVANHSVNTLVSRMRGHFEADRSVLKRTVRWEEWLADAEADLALAQKLGGKSVLMGHSTGALLLTWLAIRNPDKIAGLILFSPAFGVHSFAQTGAWTSYLTGINLTSANGKFQTGHSGLEVDRAARAFRAWLRANSQDGRSYTYAAERLKNVPVWMANTAADIVIQKQEARAFIEGLKGNGAFTTAREELWLPYSRGVLHNAIIAPSNPDLPLIKASLCDFLSHIH